MRKFTESIAWYFGSHRPIRNKKLFYRAKYIILEEESNIDKRLIRRFGVKYEMIITKNYIRIDKYN